MANVCFSALVVVSICAGSVFAQKGDVAKIFGGFPTKVEVNSSSKIFGGFPTKIEGTTSSKIFGGFPTIYGGFPI